MSPPRRHLQHDTSASNPSRTRLPPASVWWTDIKGLNPFNRFRRFSPPPPSPPPPPQRAGKFLVTGATHGIGRFTVQKLAAAGHIVIVHGRNMSDVKAVIAELKELGSPEAYGYVADLSLMAEVRLLANAIALDHPQLNGLLNNAATFNGDYAAPPTEASSRVITSEGNEYSLAVNVLAPFLLTSILLPCLRRSEDGRVRDFTSRDFFSNGEPSNRRAVFLLSGESVLSGESFW